MRCKIILLNVVFVFASYYCTANPYSVKHFTATNGLKSNRTLRVCKDTRGFYWFGSLKGLQRFDGYVFKEFPVKSSTIHIPNNFEVHKFFFTRDSCLLVATSIGLLEFDEVHNQFIHIPFPDENDDYRVTDICTINDSTYFANSHSKKGVFMYRRDKRIMEHAHSRDSALMRSPLVRQVLKGPGSTYFFHISYDLYIYDIRSDVFTKCEQGELPDRTFHNYGITDKNNVFWILSGTGLYYMAADGKIIRLKDIDTYCPLNKQIGSSIIPATDSSLYVGFDWWGVMEISLHSKKVISVVRKTDTEFTEFTSNQLYSLFADPDGSLWWCNDGAYQLTKEESGMQFLQSGKFDETTNYAVLDILEDSKGTIWVGTDGGGLHQYSTKENKTIPVAALTKQNLPKSKVILSLFEDSDKELWVGTYGDGLYKYNYKTNHSVHFVYSAINANSIQNNNIFDIAQDRYNNVVVSSFCQSVNIFNKQTSVWKHLSADNGVLRANCVAKIESDKKGDLWFGYTDDGFDLYNQERQTMSNSVEHTTDRVFSILPENDTVWLGGFKGLTVYSKKQKRFITVPICDAFENIRIYDIFKDSYGRYWIASENGLFYFYIHDTSPSYSKYDKYFINNVAKRIYETRNGELLIGGINGLLSASVKLAGNATNLDFKIHFTDFRLFGKTVILTDNNAKSLFVDDLETISLPYYQNYIGLSFSTLEIANVEIVNFAIKVENFYPQWQTIEDGKNNLELPNLQPGTYKIDIKASLKGNDREYTIRTLILTITPPFWMTVWFKMFVSLIILVSILLKIRQVKNKNKVLSKIVEERTKDLKFANTKLANQNDYLSENQIVIKMKNEELTEAFTLKTKLIGVIAHDVKNPLSALTGFVSLLKSRYKDLSDENKYTYVDAISTITNTLSEQMLVLLDWANGQANSIIYKPIEISLESLVVDALQLLQHSANEKEIVITIKAEFEHNALVDARMISTVFRNLLNNAIKFTNTKGSIMIVIHENETELEVSFIDSGIGMNEDKAEMLFQAFNPDNIGFDTNSKKGTGLGLQICKDFVDKNNGKISVTSTLKEGSVFTVLLPKAESQAHKQNKNSEISVVKYDNLGEEDSDRYTILLIEDNEDIMKVLKIAFISHYEIVIASDGMSGLQTALNILPDIIISDINMPTMNGLDMCKKIRQNILTQHIPVILITAENTELQSYELGATDFLRKPFDIKILQKKVDAFLLNRRNYKKKIESELASGTYNLPLSGDDEIMNKILGLIKENFTDSDFNISEIADKVGLSRTQLWRKIKSTSGKSPSELIKDMRLNKAVEMLKSKKYRISEIAYHIGFSDQRYFSRIFQKEFGVTPSEYMTKHSEKEDSL